VYSTSPAAPVTSQLNHYFTRSSANFLIANLCKAAKTSLATNLWRDGSTVDFAGVKPEFYLGSCFQSWLEAGCSVAKSSRDFANRWQSATQSCQYRHFEKSLS
jgi:hypothetical protein